MVIKSRVSGDIPIGVDRKIETSGAFGSEDFVRGRVGDDAIHVTMNNGGRSSGVRFDCLWWC